jgi:RNA polymerase sigma-70 factor (ECF subfamily)
MTNWFTDYHNSTDEQLMQLVANNNPAGVKELYKRYSKKLLSYLFRMLGGDEDKAQDFLQEIFLRIVDKAADFDSGQKFQTWVFSISSNLCKNEYRRLKVRNKTENDSDLDQHFSVKSDHECTIDYRDLESAIQKELMKIDDQHRQTFLLRFQQNYTIREISEILNCPDGTVKSRLHHTTRRLASKLQEYNPYLKEEK